MSRWGAQKQKQTVCGVNHQLGKLTVSLAGQRGDTQVEVSFFKPSESIWYFRAL
jgi:hypothetical protein